MSGYTVGIRQNETGFVRRYATDLPYERESEGGATNFLWTDGNYGCDCNLANFFADCLDEERPELPCGHTRYSVIYFELPDGRKIYPDEANP